MKKKKILKISVITILILAIIGITAVLGINQYVKQSAKERIITSEQAAELTDIDCIIVLGCQVKNDGRPSDMLKDRLDRGVELYELGAAPKIIMSGDHGQKEYDEVNTMKQYAVDAGVPSEDIFMDHAGFSTYESIYRAKEIFEADKIIVVTQEYHLYRALYIADKLGIDAYGVSADYHIYAGQSMREFREILARLKDFITTIIKPEPTYLGEAIPVSGNGNLTNDENVGEPVITVEESYVYKSGKDMASLSLSTDDKKCSFTLSMLSSYWPVGTYEETEQYIVMTTNDNSNKYTFEKKNGNLIFIADKSSKVPSYRYSSGADAEVCIPDGAVFTQNYKDE